ncbi:TIGR04255 family protein [Mesorhizobium delmotii]|uniref:TIGR04255 family protein n=1 Tax=Mesorhizobium delmotii TaxID=1631247 RepID=A0A2P9APH1_9HYPH|nr:TIGR04255 family protein [Mesorhizobium delmotii]SJM33029.1 conserved hypothetical protein [Mesorhizobium delmotii]
MRISNRASRISPYTVIRSPDLPDFKNPPLHEVVLGVQFNAVRGYHQILSYEIWNLFRERFPVVQEQPALVPQFETFGLPSRQQLNFEMISGAMPARYWFIGPDSSELLQFQGDRLLHNWRKVDGAVEADYPRFEKMIEKFEVELRALENYFLATFKEKLVVNQCEVSYINHIFGEERRLPPKPTDWLSFLNFGDRLASEEFTLSLRDVVRADDGKPRARLHCDAASAANPQGQRLIQLTLTARGIPLGDTGIGGALAFLHDGRDRVVRLFAQATTARAHKVWQRVK